jgi:hypothetical protein
MTILASKRKSALLGLPLLIAGTFLTLTISIQAAGTVIDPFDTTQFPIKTSTDNDPQYSVVDGEDILGGERDLKVERTSGGTDRWVGVSVGDGELSHSQDNDAYGYSQITWDGNDDSAETLTYTLDTDLTAGGADRFHLVLDPDLDGANITITVYSSPTHWSVITETNIPSDTTDLYFSYTDFVTGASATAGADFSDAGAIALEIDGRSVDSLDVLLDLFETQGPPTAVTLTSLNAEWDGERVSVAWETAQEMDNLGFNLYRSTSADGPYVKLNESLIPSQSPGSVAGAAYTWVDEDVEPGVTYYYKLEDIEVSGVHTLHGPVTASIQGPTAVSVVSFKAQGANCATAVPVGLLLISTVGLMLVPRLRRV